MSETKTPIEIAIEKVESTFQNTSSKRDVLITKLMEAVDKMSLLPDNESPKVIEQKLGLINALDGLLKSSETHATSLAKLQMQKKDTESADTSRQMIIEMLKNINIAAVKPKGTAVVIPPNLDGKINEAISATGHDIDDTELESQPNE